MRNFYILLSTFLIGNFLQAQIVTIPDANFKNALVNTNCVDTDANGVADADADLNDDGEVQITEAQAVLRLNVYDNSISSLDGIEAFTNLIVLRCSLNNLNNLDVSSNLQLEQIVCENNQLVSINVTDNLNLQFLSLDSNNINSLDISNNVNLIGLEINDNQLTSLDLSNNNNLQRLMVINNNLTSVDISNLIDLEIFRLGGMSLQSLDISNNINLEWFTLSDNLTIPSIDFTPHNSIRSIGINNTIISDLDLSNNLNLSTLDINNNQFSDIDVSNNVNLSYIDCSNNQLTTLNLNNLPELEQFYCDSNQLETLFVKTGGQHLSLLSFASNPDLVYVCVNEFHQEFFESNIEIFYGYDCTVNSYCSFAPGGEYFTIEGQNNYDFDGNGCDVNDTNYANLKFNINDGSSSGDFYSNTNGAYFIPVQEGTHVLTPIAENTNYYTVSPSSVSVEFPLDGDALIQDFCITPLGSFNDLEIVIIPFGQARPGFDTNYRLVFKNKGTTVLSGTVNFQFNDDLMDLVQSTPIANNISVDYLEWNFTDLEPFEDRFIDVTMSLNTPTDPDFPLNADDELGFTASVNPIDGDETISDNMFELKQVVVNSYDPNDKTCLEGETITPELVGDYVHYRIRFENTGSASAINVVVKDEIDTSKFDINTLIPLYASHNFVTRIKNTNEVEFIFENINLPFDDANNDGFVVFKIKTLETLNLGDTFTNDAEIYFDFNFPIITNDYLTTVAEDNLSIEEYISNPSIKLFPNPVNDILSISSEMDLQSISISDINGRILQTISFIGYQKESHIDLEHLSKGVYFVTVKTEKGEASEKIIKD